ncbi:MAG: hypothetical protein KIS66_16545 [Fimbriimonadaceae bacterium]|nr:hypothetical protein [Fimbriimonadaceae bacterium]
MNKKLAVRSLVALVILGGLFWGYTSVKKVNDFDPGTVDSVDWVVATEETPSGSQIVVFDKTDKLRRTPGYTENVQERDPVWNKAGDRIFYVSDREDNAFHIYRWNLARDEVRRRTLDQRSKSAPFYGSPELTGTADIGLVLSGGRVLEFDHKEAAMRQLLPPLGREVGRSEEGGAQGQFDQMYEKLGSSFRIAKYGKNREWIAAVMRRQEGGEVLILQSLLPARDSDDDITKALKSRPLPIVAGDRVDIDVNVRTGAILFAVQGFDFPDRDELERVTLISDAAARMRKQFQREPNIAEVAESLGTSEQAVASVLSPQGIWAALIGPDGTIRRPIRNVLGYVDPEKPNEGQTRFTSMSPLVTMIAAAGDDKLAFREPSVSPDGTRIALVTGTVDANQQFAPEGLALVDFAPAAGQTAHGLVKGAVSSPSWHPLGEDIVFLMRDGARSIYRTSRIEGAPRRISDGKTNYSSPSFSPQVPKS